MTQYIIEYTADTNSSWDVYYKVLCRISGSKAYHVQAYHEAPSFIRYTNKCEGLYSYIVCLGKYPDNINRLSVRRYKNRM